MHTKANEPVPIKVIFGAITDNVTRSAGVLLPAGHSVKAIHITNLSAITGDNSNRYSFTVKKGTPASPTTIASLDLVTGVNLVANTPRAFDLSAVSDATKQLSATDVLHVTATKNGTAANTDWTEVSISVVPVTLTRDVIS